MGADAKIDLEKVRRRPNIFLMRTSVQNVIEIHRSSLPVYQSVIKRPVGWRSVPELWM